MPDPTSPMNGYAFTASMIQSVVSLAWPAAFVIVALLFRERLRTLLPFLRVKHKDWEASFRLDQAEKEAAELPPTPTDPPPPSPPTPEEQDRFVKLVKISPAAAVTELRRELEAAVGAVAKAHHIPAGVSLLSMTRALRARGIIDPHTSALLDDLRSIGNQAAHASSQDRPEITKEDALRYRKLADNLIRRLEFAYPVPWDEPTSSP